MKEKRRVDALKQWSNPEIKSKITGSNNGMYGKHHSEESRNKISEKRKGQSPGNKNLIPVLCVELDKIYNCASDAAKEIGVYSGTILQVCRGNRKTSGGYHWRFLLGNNI